MLFRMCRAFTLRRKGSIKTRIRVSHEPQLRSTDGPLLMVSPSRLLSQHILISFHSTIDSIYPYTLYETLRRTPRSKINLARWDPRNSLTHEVPMSQQCPRHGSFIIRKHHHCISTYILDDRMTDQSFWEAIPIHFLFESLIHRSTRNTFNWYRRKDMEPLPLV